jgi:transposase
MCGSEKMMGSSGTRLSGEEREELVKLYRAGEKVIAIAAMMGCSEGSIQKWIRRARARGVDLPPRKKGARGSEDGRRL